MGYGQWVRVGVMVWMGIECGMGQDESCVIWEFGVYVVR